MIGYVPRGKMADDRVILLSAHMDTYPASDEEAMEFQPRVEDGYLVGRGSADAKASLAAMLAGFTASLDSPHRRESYVVASVDEEYGLCGCQKLCSHSMRPHLAITGEPTSLVPIYAQKGIVRASIYVSGEVAHAAYPRLNNALFSAASLLSALELWNKELALMKSDCGLGITTLTPTRVESDGDMNKTPQGVRIWFHARILPGQSVAKFLADLQHHLKDSAIGTFELEPQYFSSPPNRCSTEDPLVLELFSKIASTTGTCIPETFSYGSEAGVLASISTAALVLGPGDPKYSHGPGERVLLDEVVAAADIYKKILSSSMA